MRREETVVAVAIASDESEETFRLWVAARAQSPYVGFHQEIVDTCHENHAEDTKRNGDEQTPTKNFPFPSYKYGIGLFRVIFW